VRMGEGEGEGESGCDTSIFTRTLTLSRTWKNPVEPGRT
jgi:hypothetical protein